MRVPAVRFGSLLRLACALALLPLAAAAQDASEASVPPGWTSATPLRAGVTASEQGTPYLATSHPSGTATDQGASYLATTRASGTVTDRGAPYLASSRPVMGALNNEASPLAISALPAPVPAKASAAPGAEDKVASSSPAGNGTTDSGAASPAPVAEPVPVAASDGIDQSTVSSSIGPILHFDGNGSSTDAMPASSDGQTR